MKSLIVLAAVATAVLAGCLPSPTAPEAARVVPAPAPVAAAPLVDIAFSAGSAPGFARWLCGEVRDEHIELCAGSPAFARMSFTPVAGRAEHWYYRYVLPAALPLAERAAVVLEARVRVAVEGPVNPRTQVNLYGSFDVYADASRQEKLHPDSVTTFSPVAIRDGWQTITSDPIQPAIDADGQYVLSGLFIGARQPEIGRRMTFEVASLVLRQATTAETAALAKPPPTLRGHEGQSFPIQDGTFRYGTWGSLWEGDYPWHAYLDPVPRHELELCNIENALEANFDLLWTPRVHHPAMGAITPEQAPVDEVIRLVRAGAAHGIASVANTYLSQYYSPHVPLDDCARAVRETVARLKDEPGVIAYYAIDEPKLDAVTQATWVWAKEAFAAADPTRPLLGSLDNRTCIRTYASTDSTPLLDIYPLTGGLLRTTGGDPMLMPRCVDLAIASGSHAAWIIPQAFATSFTRQNTAGWRLPSPAELRLMVWASLAHGARGVQWFLMNGSGLCHGLEDQEGLVGIFGAGFSPVPGFGAEAVALGARIPLVGQALIGTHRDAAAERLLESEPQTDPVQATWQSGDAWDVLMVYNRDVTARRTRNLVVPAALLRGREVYRLATGERLGHPEGGIAIDLQPGDGEVMIVADAAHAATALAGVAQRRADMLARRLRFRAVEATANHIAVPPGVADMRDPAALAAATTALDAACAGDAVFTGANTALRRLQPIVTEAANIRARQVAATYPRYDAQALAAMRDWNRQVVRCSGIYVLLRNALYVGQAAEVQPLAEAAGVLAEQLRAQAAAGTFALVDGEALDKLYRSCLTLRRL